MPQITMLDGPPGNWDLQNNSQKAAHFSGQLLWQSSVFTLGLSCLHRTLESRGPLQIQALLLRNPNLGLSTKNLLK